jgi:hypothetical protein
VKVLQSATNRTTVKNNANEETHLSVPHVMKQNLVHHGDSHGIKSRHPMKRIVFKEVVTLREPQSDTFNK